MSIVVVIIVVSYSLFLYHHEEVYRCNTSRDTNHIREVFLRRLVPGKSSLNQMLLNFFYRSRVFPSINININININIISYHINIIAFLVSPFLFIWCVPRLFILCIYVCVTCSSFIIVINDVIRSLSCLCPIQRMRAFKNSVCPLCVMCYIIIYFFVVVDDYFFHYIYYFFVVVSFSVVVVF